MKILMIDDDDDDVEIFSSFLKKVGQPVTLERVSDGQKGLQKLLLDTHGPDFVFLDLNMPGYDGYYFLERVKTHPTLSEIPVIVFTTSRFEEDIKRTKRLGADHFLVKPNDYTKMILIVQSLLKNDMATLKNYFTF